MVLTQLYSNGANKKKQEREIKKSKGNEFKVGTNTPGVNPRRAYPVGSILSLRARTAEKHNPDLCFERNVARSKHKRDDEAGVITDEESRFPSKRLDVTGTLNRLDKAHHPGVNIVNENFLAESDPVSAADPQNLVSATELSKREFSVESKAKHQRGLAGMAR